VSGRGDQLPPSATIWSRVRGHTQIQNLTECVEFCILYSLYIHLSGLYQKLKISKLLKYSLMHICRKLYVCGWPISKDIWTIIALMCSLSILWDIWLIFHVALFIVRVPPLNNATDPCIIGQICLEKKWFFLPPPKHFFLYPPSDIRQYEIKR